MSFTCWYRDNPQNPTLFFNDRDTNTSMSTTYDIMSWVDYKNTTQPYTNFLIPFYVNQVSNTEVTGMGMLIEVNMGLSYYCISNITYNQNPIYISTTVSAYPNPPSGYYYYLSNYQLCLAVDTISQKKNYVLVIPYNYVFPESYGSFPGNYQSTILTFYFQQCYEEDRCPIDGVWELVRIVFNSNNTSNSNIYFNSMVSYFMDNGIIDTLFQQFEKTFTNQILPIEVVTPLQSKWRYQFPLNIGNVYSVC